MNNPLVSILIPAYQAERYMKETLDSALAQTYKNIEIVVIDDGSKDKTWEIIQSYKDPRIKAMRQENQGILKTRNRLFKEAHGEYFAYLDCDDIYLPTRIEECLKFLEEHKEYALVYCDLRYFFDGEPDKLYRHTFKFYSGDEVFEGLLDKMFITNTAIMFRREVYDKLGGYNEATGIVEDWEYFIRMVRNGFRIAFLDKDLVRYRLRWDSHTNFERQVVIKESQVAIFTDLKNSMTPEEQRKYKIDYWIAQRKKNLAISLLSVGRKKEAQALYKEAKPFLHPVKRLAIPFAMLVPASVLRFVIEQGWNRRKKNLFVPA